MKPAPVDEIDWFTGTPLGDRLSVLAGGYHMTFREKIQHSEQAHDLAEKFQAGRQQTLAKAMAQWPAQDP